MDYLGMNALHADASIAPKEQPYEICLRFAGRSRDKRDAVKLANEVETLVGKGPAMSSIPRIPSSREKGARSAKRPG